jgi:electron transport complex protein RnfB
MTALTIILAAGTMLALGLFMAYVLGWANVKFRVDVDPRVQQVIDALPGANCGGCGYVGCNEYAEAVVAGAAPPDKCTVGGVSCATALAKILGVELEQTWPRRPVVHCAAHYAQRLGRTEYRGEGTCGSANLIAGVQGCTYGCLGFGDCQRACQFDAIGVIDGLATVDYEKCVGCGACERACPRHIITMVPFKAEQVLVVACSNKDPGRVDRKVCTVGCIGCGACGRLNELFSVVDNLARIDYDKYEPASADLAAVLGKCPRAGLIHVGKPTAKDKAAVADEKLPDRVEVDFKTTVDKTEWHG